MVNKEKLNLSVSGLKFEVQIVIFGGLLGFGKWPAFIYVLGNNGVSPEIHPLKNKNDSVVEKNLFFISRGNDVAYF